MDLDKRFFSQNNIRTALRKLEIGINNAYLVELINNGTLPEPEIQEFTVKLWSYYRTVALIEYIYSTKDKQKAVDRNEIDIVLEQIKTRK